jgi:hypothetical protein
MQFSAIEALQLHVNIARIPMQASMQSKNQRYLNTNMQ